MDQQRIKQLIDLLGASDLSELTLSEGGSTLTLSRGAGAALPGAVPALASTAPPTAVAPAPMANPVEPATPCAHDGEVRSPLYGILHLTPAPGEAPFVVVGDTVAAGQTLCIVEAMKMFHQVKAGHPGRVLALLAEAGHEVESGQPLFRLGEAG